MEFKRIMTLPRLSLCTAAVLLALSTLNGQSVTTTPVGAVTKTINVGLNPVGINLLNPDLAVANCSANTSSVITLTGVTSAGTLLTSGLPYYIEAVSGPLEGERFDVDTTATISATNNTIVINTSSANNTYALAANDAIGTQFALRKHITLSQIQSFATGWVGNDTANLADQIWLLNSAGTNFSNYYYRASAGQWRLIGSPLSSNNLVVAPGVGILIRKVNAPLTLTMTGGIRANDFSMPMSTVSALRANPYPVNYSPSLLGASATLGWTGNDTAANADQLKLLNAAGTSFNTYYLRANGTNWRLLGSPTNVEASELFKYDSVYMISRKTADSDYILTTPFSL